MDTIVALSSGLTPAAIAIIRTSGPQAHAAAERLAGVLPVPRQATLRALRDPRSGLELDTALLLRFDAPRSATGENIIEYQCHGGRAVVAAILDALTSFEGMRFAEPGEFTRRALSSGRIDLTEAEGLADLLEAETERQRRAALALAGGALSRQIDAWQARVLSLSAHAEAAIDYVGDEDETDIGTDELFTHARDLAAELDEWLARPRAEPLKQGIRVVVAGPPNAGKSSLVNALVGTDRAIVTPIPGTTRDTIEVPLAIDGIPIILIDTAGLRGSHDPIEALGIARAEAEVKRADILLWLDDPCAAPRHGERLIVQTKSDLGLAANDKVDLHVSAKTGENLSQLLNAIADRARRLLPRENEIALNARQAAAVTDAALCLRSTPADLVLLAEAFRATRHAFDRLTGRAGIDDAIDLLFARFCLGK